jgi:prevent-host-death family protein
MQTRQSIGVRELKERTTEILRRVRLKGTEIQITYRGKVVARLIPVRQSKSTSPASAAIWTDLDRLAAEIGARWPKGVTAVDAVREGRREL